MTDKEIIEKYKIPGVETITIMKSDFTATIKKVGNEYVVVDRKKPISYERYMEEINKTKDAAANLMTFYQRNKANEKD